MKKMLKGIFGGKKIAIVGFGREGKSTYKLLRSIFPDMLLTICDVSTLISESDVVADDKNVSLVTGDDYQSTLQDYELIIKSPGVKLQNSQLPEDRITSQTDIFLRIFGSQTIGITGTKGKSTTSTLTHFIIKESGLKSVLLGNIGIPAFDMLDMIDSDTIVVYELSAHQLEYSKHSPHIGILLNVFPEHLDYFDSLDKYRTAKLNIGRFQNSSDLLIISEAIVYNGPQRIERVLNDAFEFDDMLLKGEHNRINAMIAIAAVQAFGVDTENAKDIVSRFPGLPHRLELVGENDGVIYYNDSISTIPQSAIAAVRALENVDTIILGGYDRGIDYKELTDFLAASEVRNFIFMGDAGKRMMGLFSDDISDRLFFANNLENAVNIAQSRTAKGKICLLSPAAASYDQFHNFEHRGDMFRGMVCEFRD